MYARAVRAPPIALIALAAPFALSAPGCGDPTHRLDVDVETDLVAGVELHGLQVDLSKDLPTAAPMQRVREVIPVRRGVGLDAPIEAATFPNVAPGDTWLFVTALGADGRPLVSRPAFVEVREDQRVTIVLSRTCRGVACAPDQACIDGVCGNPRCTAEEPDACATGCGTVGDCAAPVAGCASVRCIAGACLERGDRTACAADQWCDPDRGCVVDPTFCVRSECPLEGEPCTLGLTRCDDPEACEPAGFLVNGTPCEERGREGVCDGAGLCETGAP